MARKASLTGAGVAAWAPSWELSLDAGGKSPKTIASYLGSVAKLARYAGDGPVSVDTLRAFLVAERERTSPASAQLHYRNLNVFFGWLVSEGELPGPSLMARVEKPAVARKVKPYISEADMTALIKACQAPKGASPGRAFAARRDEAIVWIFYDTGVRVSGLADLRYDPDGPAASDVFLAQHKLRVRLKGGEEWWVPMGRTATLALDRYLRARARYLATARTETTVRAGSPWLWLGVSGHRPAHFTAWGVRQMLLDLGARAQLAHRLHPHRFRHTFMDNLFANEGSVDDAMNITGIKTPAIVLDYARGRNAERAQLAQRRLSAADRLAM